MPDTPNTGGTITLPGGLKVKKNVAIGIGVAAVIIAAAYYYRSRQAASSEPYTPSAEIDPQTGYPYGSPEDQAALAALSGSTIGQMDSSSWVGGQTIGYDQYGNPVYGQGGGGVPGSFTNNAQWTQAAEAYMGSDGNDAIAAALGKYITGQPLTDTQVTTVQSAIASQGYPPIAGPTGFPPSYHTQEAPSPSAKPRAKNPVPGLEADPKYTQIDVHWRVLPNATSYVVKLHDNGRIARERTIKGTFLTFHNVKRNHAYRVSVWGKPGNGSPAHVPAHTK